MGADSNIEWTRHTHNPWIGCTAVSPACDHCYAEQLGKRFGVKWGAGEERRRTSEAYRRQPFTWDRAAAKAGRVDAVFCASLADIWDNAVPIEWLVEELDTIRLTLHLRWLLLTKRPQLIRRRLDAALKHLSEGTDRDDLIGWLALWLSGNPPPNVWLGTTVENQAEADRRIPHLLAMPAAKRFLSCEPLLGAVDLSTAWNGESALDAECWGDCKWCESGHPPLHNCQRGRQSEYVFMHGLGIDWIIAGGESGPKARPSHPDWFRSLRDQCQSAGVPFFFKQWGEWREFDHGSPDEEVDNEGELADAIFAVAVKPGFVTLDGRFIARRQDIPEEMPCRLMERVGKHLAGATLDGREWREVPRV